MAKSITHRIINPKHHTVGFVLTGGRRISRSEAIALANRNEIKGVRVVGSGKSRYIQSSGPDGLYTLPTMGETSRKTARKSTSPSK